MAISKEENDLLTRVEGDAPLGEMLREHFWIPAIPADKLVSDGKPYRVRLMGVDYVIFKNTDGEVGILDELCPHRRASLALGRNENNGLRCIYHGWKFNKDGELIDAPNVQANQEQFCKSVKINKYVAVERGGIVWVWLGQKSEKPAFPALPFVDLPKEQRSVTSVEVPTNWLQGVEASMDTTHVSFLHQSTVELTAGGTQIQSVTSKKSAKLEFEDRPYGFRYAAIRELGDNKYYSRINNFVMPWYAIVCPSTPDGATLVFFSTPVDDLTHRAWFVSYNANRPKLELNILSMTEDSMNWPPLPPGGPKDNWGQNRTMMAFHFTGFPQHLATEDFAMFLSQGPIYDRSKEQLCASDGAIVRLRNMLLQSIKETKTGKRPVLASATENDYSLAISKGLETTSASAWKEAGN